MEEVINRGLYRLLQRAFRRVKVANPGEAFLAEPSYNMVTKKPCLDIHHAGEGFYVDCPFCHDLRGRLYINHMWGKRDGHGRIMRFLAVCYNDTACMSKEENQYALMELLETNPRYLENVTVRIGKKVAEEDRVVLLPGPCVRLDHVEATHPARAYVESRGFDPDMLARDYGISYCVDSHYTFARDRLLIPIIDYGQLKGWQARFIGELPWKDKTRSEGLPPKYFSCPGMRRSKLIYNWDRMRWHETGVIVEGPTDVWSLGFMGGCLFGNTLSSAQRQKLLAVFRHRSLVMLLDPEEFDSASTRRLRADFERNLRGVAAFVKLPDGTDPGSLDRDFLRDFIYHEALAQGVTVSWNEVPIAADQATLR